MKALIINKRQYRIKSFGHFVATHWWYVLLSRYYVFPNIIIIHLAQAVSIILILFTAKENLTTIHKHAQSICSSQWQCRNKHIWRVRFMSDIRFPIVKLWCDHLLENICVYYATSVWMCVFGRKIAIDLLFIYVGLIWL